MSYFVEKVVSTARLTRFTGRFQLATMPAVLFTRGKGRKKILQKKRRTHSTRKRLRQQQQPRLWMSPSSMMFQCLKFELLEVLVVWSGTEIDGLPL